MMPKMESWGFVRITACSKHEWKLEPVRAAQGVGKIGKAEKESRTGDFINGSGKTLAILGKKAD